MASLTFSLVSPERELFSGTADGVVVPGTEGIFEVGPGHAPIMSTLSPGMLVIRTGAEENKYFVRGGFADVTSAGLTVLAEVAIPAGDLSGDVLAQEKALATKVQADAGSTPEDKINAERALSVLG